MSFEIIAGNVKPNEILNVRRLPARLNAEQAAALLGFSSHDIPILIAAKLLRPLGKPVPNATKWFAACVIDALRGDVEWMGSATKAISDRWKTKNAKLKSSNRSREGPPV